ncbi:aldehyde dehydrogenase family protein [Arthrobacter globiformis]|uniref:aldehyde dehydrogenase family protein n=1 Tax=Arthrobacter globiformis TaxID=1665 RepID=UPI00278F7E37|nr:aldehyde dehydrogenase family protein [Arthrobacter globiformis]MDQ0616698.1 acyl-CoA reductase-like NAD-dependent aldehyde dehydrogenase [Arthrobacter globiformis]
MTDFLMTVNGDQVAAATTFGVINPATGEIFSQAPECSREQLDLAMESARRAQPNWAAEPAARRSALVACAAALKEEAPALAVTLSAEQGKPLKAAEYEIVEAARWLQASSELELKTTVVRDDQHSYAEVVHRPLGVVAAITPWNFPVLLVGWKVGPALLAGNTVVLKPSPYTPLTTLLIGSLLAKHLPPGVLNVVSGGDELGSWMTSHPDVAKISFTGSVATGKKVAANAVADLKRFTLELGGNDAAIILDDADPATVAKDMFWGAFINNGQICAGIKRIFVPRPLHDEFVAAFAARAGKVRVGPGDSEGVQVGPVQNKMQFDKVTELVADALANGATAVAGGLPSEGPGYFFPPTVLTGVKEGMRIVDEEQFGPAVPVMPYDDVEEVIDRANATKFGLSGSVWSPNIERAQEVAARLDCGTAFVNDHLALGPDLPFGGIKWSGYGVENGPWGLEEFMNIQVRYTARPKPAKIAAPPEEDK